MLVTIVLFSQLRKLFTIWSTMQAWLCVLLPGQWMELRCSLESITWVGGKNTQGLVNDKHVRLKQTLAKEQMSCQSAPVVTAKYVISDQWWLKTPRLFLSYHPFRSFLLDFSAAGLAEALGPISGHQPVISSSHLWQDPFWWSERGEGLPSLQGLRTEQAG